MLARVEMLEVNLSTSYWGSDEEDFKKQQEPFIAAGFTPLPWDQERTYRDLIAEESKQLVDKLKFADWSILGVKMEVLRTIVSRVDVTEALQEMAEKNLTITTTGGNEYNNKCEVHMPGQALSVYNDMLLLEDTCTDALQDELNKGWRIIAACPQPNQRRPDYILGRYNPDRDITAGAER